MTDLKQLRDRIDKIDEKLTELFEDRLYVSADVARVKRETGGPVYVPEREKEKIEKVKACARSREDEESIASLYRHIMLLSRMKQYGMLFKDEDPAVDLKGSDAISICFDGSVDDTLYTVLTFLCAGGLTVTRIDLKPAEGSGSKCGFCMNITGDLSGENGRAALKAISKETDNFRILWDHEGGIS